MTTVGEALRDGARRLGAVGVEGAARDARLLMAGAIGVAPGRLVLMSGEALPASAGAAFGAMLAARERRQPVSQILGRRVFWGRELAVTRDVLDPRPETEALVAAALAGPEPARLLDLGTGSGAILVTLLAEWPLARGTGTDASPPALAVARRNAARHGVAPRAHFRLADWGEGLDGGYDLVVSNPPYIAAADYLELAPEVRDWEPRLALCPGTTGLEAYRGIAAALGGLMAPGGRALLELGAGQAATAGAVFAAAGFSAAAVHPDLDGRPRVLELRVAAK